MQNWCGMKYFVIIALVFSLMGCKAVVSSGDSYGSSGYPIIQKGKNIVIDGKVFGKTSFATVIPKGDSVTIPSDFCKRIGNVFVWDRTVTLEGYEISQCEVTQELYEFVMGSLPYDDSDSIYPGGRYGGNCRIGVKMRICP